jgi:hypothetical protein
MEMNPETAVKTNWQAGMREKTGCGVIAADAGTHGKCIQNLCVSLTWIPACAGMTVAMLPVTVETRKLPEYPWD